MELAKKRHKIRRLWGNPPKGKRPHDERVREATVCENEGDAWSREEKEQGTDEDRNNRETKEQNKNTISYDQRNGKRRQFETTGEEHYDMSAKKAINTNDSPV